MWVATKWWAKAMSTLKQPNDIDWYHFHLHISAKSISKLSSASSVVNYSQLSSCQGDIEPFEGDPSTRGCLRSLRNNPQQKQTRKLPALIPG